MGIQVAKASDRQALRRATESFFVTRDQDTRNQIVAGYQALAYSLAVRFQRRGEDLDDLNQVAMIGLMKAIDRYDPRRGVELTTYATATILGELKRHLRDRGWSVRLPRRIHDLHLRAQQSVDMLTQELGRSPTMLEVADRASASVEDVVEALEAGSFRHNASLEGPAGGEEYRTLAGRLGDGDHGMARVDGQLALQPLLSRLPEREQEILRLRFVEGYTQTEIAGHVGVSQMQVSRLLARSLDRMRNWAEEDERAGRPAATAGRPVGI